MLAPYIGVLVVPGDVIGVGVAAKNEGEWRSSSLLPMSLQSLVDSPGLSFSIRSMTYIASFLAMNFSVLGKALVTEGDP
ncbi:hypothetical protein J6590_009604 [Homalodisca vitripennis]|nr:hypothetical protein J6590_009604 [Homalodisca vitripennis]